MATALLPAVAVVACQDVAPTTTPALHSLAATTDVSTLAKAEPSLIAYVSGRAGMTDLYIMDAANGRSHAITRDRANAWSPAWSPDGTRIAFGSFRNGGQDLYVMNADGTGLTRITNGVPAGSRPRWSSRGIVFDAPASGTPSIFLINPDGTGLTQLTRGSSWSYNAAWKP